MSVFVTMTVKPPDAAKFEEACRKEFGKGLPAGAKSQFWAKSENDPSLFVIAGEWESHDAMHAQSEKTGEQFNKDAGTEGVEWETHVWHYGS